MSEPQYLVDESFLREVAYWSCEYGMGDLSPAWDILASGPVEPLDMSYDSMSEFMQGAKCPNYQEPFYAGIEVAWEYLREKMEKLGK